MKVVCVLGSPRAKGNSAVLAKQFCDAAEKRGATVQTFALNKLEYRGCQSCMACKTKSETCVLKDGLTEVLEAVRECDVLVMATPTYYGEVSSQLKGFIDRTFSYLVPDFATNPKPSRLQSGKHLVFIQVQTDPDPDNYADVFPRYDTFFHWYGFGKGLLIRAVDVTHIGDMAKKPDVMKLAEKAAETIIR